MKIGFNLFKTRPVDDRINISELEEKYNLKLPPLYSCFIESFYPEILIDKFFDKKKKELFTCFYYEYEQNKGVMFDNFVEIEKLLIGWIKNEYSDEHYEWNFLPIGTTHSNIAICLGLEGDMKDKIILDIGSYNSDYEIVSNNIFEFIRGIKSKELNGLWNGVKYNQLYKNWGEDFWRVRKEEEEK